MKQTIFKAAFRSTLCLVLCPVLCAQETVPSMPTAAAQSPTAPQTTATQGAAQRTTEESPSSIAVDPVPEKLLLPVNTSINLYLLDRVSSATATVGMPVRFAVGSSFVFGGVTLLREGTVVTGKVVKVQRAVASKDHARLEIKLDNVVLGKGMELTLTQQWIESRRDKIDEIGMAVFAAPFIALFSPFLLAEKIAADHENKPTGEEIVHAACTSDTYHAESELMVTTANLEPSAAGAHVDLESLCPDVRTKRRKDNRCSATNVSADALCVAPKTPETPKPSKPEQSPSADFAAPAIAQAQ